MFSTENQTDCNAMNITEKFQSNLDTSRGFPKTLSSPLSSE